MASALSIKNRVYETGKMMDFGGFSMFKNTHAVACLVEDDQILGSSLKRSFEKHAYGG